jgi:hypothetical protein
MIPPATPRSESIGHAQRFIFAARVVDDSNSGKLSSPFAAMTLFNPLTGSLLPATPVQRAAEKDRQIARSQALRKNTAAEGDTVEIEHQVESADELPQVGDETGGGSQNPRQQQPPSHKPPESDNGDESPPRLDVTA